MGQPTPADLRWSDIESALRALGCEISEGSGSRVRMALNGARAVFHRPHPSPQTKRSSVRAVREFLISAGLKTES
jgi:hypothetical protein